VIGKGDWFVEKRKMNAIWLTTTKKRPVHANLWKNITPCGV